MEPGAAGGPPGTFNANPLSAAASVAMLSLISDGQHHRHADSLVARLVPALNDAIRGRKVPGGAYGLASYFHIVLGQGVRHPREGIEWPWQNGQHRLGWPHIWL